ncbi:MAG: hypothetical protein Q9167_001474 [Letrouitia subvulpina]
MHLLRRTAAPVPSPLERLADSSKAWLPDIVKRGASSSSDCSTDNSGSQCKSPAEANNITLPVALGVVIPIVCALALFYWLHRRHLQRLRREDANDPHKSLDFGIDHSTSGNGKKKGKKGQPEMTINDFGTEKNGRRRGLSMDMDLGSPYVLPPGLQGSRESLHSLSRTIHSKDDRYRPATTFVPNDSGSLRSNLQSRRRQDDSSSNADSGSSGRGYVSEGMNQNLLKNAQRMSRSLPPRQRTPDTNRGIPEIRTPEPAMDIGQKGLPPTPQSANLGPGPIIDSRDSYLSRDGADLRKSNNYLGPLIHSRDPSADLLAQPSNQILQGLPASPAATLQKTEARQSPPPAIRTDLTTPRPPRKQSLQAVRRSHDQQNFLDDASDYGDSFNVIPPSPDRTGELIEDNVIRRPRKQSIPAHHDPVKDDMAALSLGYDIRRLSMGFRPLPPDDPSDNPEQRANRIRSFYKEYFDESKNGPSQPAGAYYEDYDQEYLVDAAIYDPSSGQFVVSQPKYSEPYGRRAMTPPPRAPPRFRGAGRHHATMSSGRIISPGPRAFSSASGRYGAAARGRRPPLPPPTPLRVLPTPHLIKEDSFALPIDFAPPSSYKDRAAGRPESPRGGSRPYSPMVPAHLPLASSFDDLTVMPSPHLLRKSGTFTALDFAPPPRFKSNDTTSDAGSIRSNRSAMSAQQLQSIRAGAYRVSRIPKEVVGTRDDMGESLKPQWNMRP